MKLSLLTTLMFLNGVYQEPEVSYTLDGSILTFSEAPRANSEVLIYIYTGSNLDIVTEDTFSALDLTTYYRYSLKETSEDLLP